MLQRIVLFTLCLAFSLSSSADEKRAPSSAAGKAAAMKYIQGRKPAQEQPITSAEDMRLMLKELYAQLDEDRPNQEKYEIIQRDATRLGTALGVMIKQTTDDSKLQDAYRYHDDIIFLSQLKLNAKGLWDRNTCTMVYTIAKNNNSTANAAEEQPTPSEPVAADGLTPITEEIKKICGR